MNEFVLLDSVQFTKNDWRNRNRIKTSDGAVWLTIPIRTAGRFSQCVSEAEIADRRWARRHWRSIAQNYARAPHFRLYADDLEEAYCEAGRETRLSRINRLFLDLLCRWLGVETRITCSECYPDRLERMNRMDRLIAICHAAGADRYVSGPSARCYLDPERFEVERIELTFFDYSGYDEYPQLYPPFVHEVSAIDLVLNAGPDSAGYLLCPP